MPFSRSGLMLNSTFVNVPIILSGVSNCMKDLPWKYLTTRETKEIKKLVKYLKLLLVGDLFPRNAVHLTFNYQPSHKVI